MSLYGALFGGVSGLRAQSSKIGTISDNIANVNTVGYKQATGTFQTLVVNTAGGSGSYQTGGVRGGSVLNISKQGLLNSTESATDLAISGGGFFVVRKSANPIAGDTSSTPYYTRAGSFTQDELGNFKNTQGFYLQGWPLDREGRLPGEVGNLNQTSSSNFDSLETVNVESASGVANATTQISLGANLKSSQVVFPGIAQTLRPDNHASRNADIAADQIIVGTDFSLDNATSVNDVRRGDSFTITAGSSTGQPYVYGGYTIGRQVTLPSGSANYGDYGTDNTAVYNGTSPADVSTPTANTIQLTIPSHGLITGDTIDLTGFTLPIGATPTTQLNATHVVTVIDANHITITPATPPGVVVPPADTFQADTRIYQGNILDAVTSTGAFLAQTGVSGFSTAALTFSITTQNGGTKVFKYTSSSPNTASGEFNSLTTLATAINTQQGLTARVVDGRLVVSAEDANESVAFANGDATGSLTQRGIDWVGELDLNDVAVGTRRFNSLNGLAALVNADPLVSATVKNPLSSSTLDINVDDPLSTIQFKDATALTTAITAASPVTFPDGPGLYVAGSSIRMNIADTPPATAQVGDLINFADLPAGLGGLPGNAPNGGPWRITAVVPGVSYEITMTYPYDVTINAGAFTTGPIGRAAIQGESNQGSLLAQLGIVPSLNGSDYLLTPAPVGGPQSTLVLGPKYDPSGTVGKNMASGDITAQFSRNVRIYDALGSGHDVRYSFIKTASVPGTWAVEIHVIPETDITTQAGLVDGQIATGTITFNGDGTLASVSPSLQGDINVLWTNGAVPSAIKLDFGTAGFPFGTAGATQIGLSDGLSQFDSAYNVNFANQNGAPVGQLVSVAITEDGLVVASYSNGETQNLYQLPLADFPNPDGLAAQSGNIFSQTRDSGEVNLREAGTNGTGTFVSAALEASNVDLAEQLTDMIVAQRAYQANTKVIKTADDLLNELNQI